VNSRPHSSRSHSHSHSRRERDPREAPLSRDERKQRTRQAIIDSALDLLAEQSLSGLSLREVTRAAGIVPAAFYRHFDSMDALGLALVDESFAALRESLRRARLRLEPEHIITSSIDVLVHSVAEDGRHWRFVTRERAGGVSAVRYAIRAEMRLIASELATDLARLEALRRWSTEDLGLLAALFVNSMASIVEALEDAEDAAARDRIRHGAEKQLRMIAVGAAGWRSGN
jgi:AcrR family transcriptional regulator